MALQPLTISNHVYCHLVPLLLLAVNLVLFITILTATLDCNKTNQIFEPSLSICVLFQKPAVTLTHKGGKLCIYRAQFSS